jgi:3-dehydroquinate synthase
MQKLTVRPKAQPAYPVAVAESLSEAATILSEFDLRGRRAAVITDTRVAALHLARVRRQLNYAGLRLIILPPVTPGERSKTLQRYSALCRQLTDAKLERGDLIIALGGGVVGDLAGFCAATYARGIRFFQIPTTLLAQVDASIGGKVGVDLPDAKNAIGAFWPPLAVLSATDFLSTLPTSHIVNGLAEVLKHGLISDTRLLGLVARKREAILQKDPGALREVVSRAAAVKVKVVSQDPLESGPRAYLNFGHTFGHAIESASDYRIPHGAAVAIGIVAATRLSIASVGLEASSLELVTESLRAVGLPVRLPEKLDRRRLLAGLLRDKKKDRGKLRFILLERLGKPVLAEEDPRSALRFLL